MSYRMKITLPDPIVTQLGALAEQRGEPAARVAAKMIEAALAEGERPPTQRVSSPARSLPARSEPDERPPWLEPYGGDSRWRALMWGSIVALHGRYSHVLAFLKEGWWEDAAHLEPLCAFVVWRDWIDDYGDDPRYELAFHAQLEDFGRALRQEGGGISSTWKPGAPPDEWTS
jgi:hypothetical protein